MDTINKMYIALQVRMAHLLYDEKGAVDIVTIVVMCGIVIFLAIIFRDKLASLIESVLVDVETTAKGAVTETP